MVPVTRSNNFNPFWKCLFAIFLNIERKSNDWKNPTNGRQDLVLRFHFFRIFPSSEKETNERYLRHIEEDQERDMHQLEQKVRDEVKPDWLEDELILEFPDRNVENSISNATHCNNVPPKKWMICNPICNAYKLYECCSPWSFISSFPSLRSNNCIQLARMTKIRRRLVFVKWSRN